MSWVTVADRELEARANAYKALEEVEALVENGSAEELHAAGVRLTNSIASANHWRGELRAAQAKSREKPGTVHRLHEPMASDLVPVPVLFRRQSAGYWTSG